MWKMKTRMNLKNHMFLKIILIIFIIVFPIRVEANQTSFQTKANIRIVNKENNREDIGDFQSEEVNGKQNSNTNKSNESKDRLPQTNEEKNYYYIVGIILIILTLIMYKKNRYNTNESLFINKKNK